MKAIDAAIAQARELGDSLVDGEHLLLGLLRDVRSIATAALGESGVSRSGVRAELLRIRGETASSATGADSLATGTTAPRSGEPAATGRLRAGERLPPVRELADRLGIAPGTVARAY